MSGLPFRFKVSPPAKPGETRELEKLVVETRKMLARVQRKGIDGYDQTPEWASDLAEVARQFFGLTAQDIVTVVEAVQDIRQPTFPEFTSEVWRGDDTQLCTQILDALCDVKGTLRARQRLEGRPGYRQWVIEVHPHRIEEARALYEEFKARRRRRTLGI